MKVMRRDWDVQHLLNKVLVTLEGWNAPPGPVKWALFCSASIGATLAIISLYLALKWFSARFTAFP